MLETITIDLNGNIEFENGMYISFCDELPLIGTGATSVDAMNSFMMCLKEYIRLSYEWGVEDKAINNIIATEKPSGFALRLPIQRYGALVGA